MSRKGYPWSIGCGIDVKDCHTAKDVMEKANLNWGVDKCELVAKMPFSQEFISHEDTGYEQPVGFGYNGNYYAPCPKAYATYRTDTNQPLGIVKSRYEVVQNVEAFNFFNDAIGDNVRWENAGYFGYGQRIFVTAKIPDTIHVGDDKIESYLVFSNTHDGSGSVSIMFTPIRVACTNMLNSAIKNADSYIRLRHTQSVKDKLELGKQVLSVALEHARNTEQLYNSLACAKMSDDKALEYITKMCLNESELAALKDIDPKHGIERLYKHDCYILENSKISTRKANQITATIDYYLTDISEDDIRGTAWGAYNAITGYYSNLAMMTDERRMDSLLYGTANKVMNTALECAYEYSLTA